MTTGALKGFHDHCIARFQGQIEKMEEQVAFWKRELKLEMARADMAEKEVVNRDTKIARFKKVIDHVDGCGECRPSSWCPICAHEIRRAIIEMFKEEAE